MEIKRKLYDLPTPKQASITLELMTAESRKICYEGLRRERLLFEQTITLEQLKRSNQESVRLHEITHSVYQAKARDAYYLRFLPE